MNTNPSYRVDIAVIGAGQSGLAVGHHLTRAGMDVRLFERSNHVGSSWSERWDSLRLFTPAQYSALPGSPFPGDPASYPEKSAVAEYLDEYAVAHDLPIMRGAEVVRAERHPGGFRLHIADGTTWNARVLIVATGPFGAPYVPSFSADIAPTITQIHSDEYRNPEQSAPGDVLVVGGGNTGNQIARELAEAGRRVHLSVSSRPPSLPQRFAGRDIFWWLDVTRIMNVRADTILGRRLRANTPIIGASRRSLIRAGVTLLPRTVGAEAGAIRLADGSTSIPHTVIWATGYRHNDRWLAIPEALDISGAVMTDDGVTPVDNLYTIGRSWQRDRGSALIGFVGRDAERLAARVQAEPAELLPSSNDPHRPSDHVDAPDVADEDTTGNGAITQPKLGLGGWLRFVWRQLTSMRTALLLLLMLAIAAVPGSLVPQRSSDPNGVIQYFDNNPGLAPVLESLQMFDVFSSAWFSAIYMLLFISLIGCIVPRTKHHLDALRARPPRTPARLSRLASYTERPLPEGADPAEAELAVSDAARRLRRAGYRIERYDIRGEKSVAAERGYSRETGNLVFHSALIGVLVSVAIGGGFGFAGQRVIVEGQSFVNTLAAFDSFNPGRFFDPASLSPYRLSLEGLDVIYETENTAALGQPSDFTARVGLASLDGEAIGGTVKVNAPLRAFGTDVFLLGNGYAPTITVRNPEGEVVFSDSVPFLPQDANLTSLGVVKVTDGLDEQLGMVGFLYPTQEQLASGAYTSTYPDLVYPVITLNVHEGDLGIDDGTPTSVYSLDTSNLTQLTGGDTGVDSIELMPGEVADLPGDRGTVTFEDASPGARDAAGSRDYSQSVKRFASFDIHHDPTQGWVLTFAIVILAGLMASLFVPRRRIWVKAVSRPDGRYVLEYAGLARGEDPKLDDVVRSFASAHADAFDRDAQSDNARHPEPPTSK